MGLADKARHEVDELKGKAKEKRGDATDDERLQGEGMADQAEANVKQTGEHSKDAARDARDTLRR